MLAMEQEYYTAEEVAKSLRVSVEKIKLMLRKGDLPGYKIGGQWRINCVEFEHYLAQQKNIRDKK